MQPPIDPNQPPPPIIIRQANNATNTLSTIVLIVLGICCGVPVIGWVAFLLAAAAGDALTP